MSRYLGCEGDVSVWRRWGIGFVFVFCLILNTRSYSAGSAFKSILLKSHKYKWLCRQDELVFDLNRGYQTCNRQQDKITDTFNIYLGTELIGSVLGGFGLTYLGPKACALIGLMMCWGSNVMMMRSSSGLDMMSAAAVIGGLSINMVSYPALILEDYFPKSSAMCAAVVIAGQNMASLVLPVTLAIWNSDPSLQYHQVMGSLLCGLMMPAGIVYLLILPSRRMANAKEKEVDVDDIELAKSSYKKRRRSSLSDTSLQVGLRQGPVVQAFLSLDFVLLVIVNTALLTMLAYYQSIVEKIAGLEVANFLGWSMPTCTFYGLLLGKLCDLIKTPAMIIIQLISYLVIFLLTMTGEGPLQYAVTTLFAITYAYTYAMKYTFVAETFPPEVRGALLGISGVLGGGVTVIVGLMNSYMEPIVGCMVVCGLAVAMLPIPLFLWHRGLGKSCEKID